MGTSPKTLALCLICMAQTSVHAQEPDAAAKTLTWAIGAGWAHSPAWLGASRAHNRPLPYIAFNWRDTVEFTVTDGLSVDLLRGKMWHGGLIGTWREGRSSHDMGRKLSRAGVSRLSNTLQAGLYLEHEPIKNLTLGADVSHDIQSTGSAYGNIYIEWDIPVLKPVEHAIKLRSEFMNQSAMRRYFALSPAPAAALGLQPYRPSAGVSGTTLSYEAFIPTSQSTGFALGLYLTRLATKPADSPLVDHYGSRMQRTCYLAFLVHFGSGAH